MLAPDSTSTIPNTHTGVVDVRDVARAHVAAAHSLLDNTGQVVPLYCQ